MTRSRISLPISAAVLSLGLIPNAGAALINFNSVGTWEDPGGVFGFNGGGTNQINWGQATTSNGQSGWRFDGASGQVDPAVDGLFRLGTFTHNNFVIRRFNFVGTILNLRITIDGVDLDLALGFTHFETPNNDNPCAAGGVQPCPDEVGFPTVDQPFSANGRDYRITGFLDAGGDPLNSFLTLEDQVNQADLFARIEELTGPPEPLPEPGTVVLLGIGCVLLAGLRRRS